MIKIAIMGYGVVGGGVAYLCREKRESLERKSGLSFSVKYILDQKAFPGDPWADRIIKDPDIIFEDPEVSLVVETMGGITAAYEYTKRALLAKKHVVTSNKELVSHHGKELLDLAYRQGVYYRYEAAVGGGIPLMVTLREALAANDILRLDGILNGTCNYILTKLSNEDMRFDEALTQAQRLGYAERNPEADVEGLDAGRKLAILASMLSGEWVHPEKIHIEGISHIDREDAEVAASLGRELKLVSMLRTKKSGDKTQYGLLVAPVLIDSEHNLSIAQGVYNAVQITADPVEDILLYGPGAGALPTASAVLGDMIEVCNHEWTEERGEQWTDLKEGRLIAYGDQEVRALIRIKSGLSSGDLSSHLHDLGGFELLESPLEGEELILTTNPKLREGRLESAISELPEEYFIRVLRLLD